MGTTVRYKYTFRWDISAKFLDPFLSKSLPNYEQRFLLSLNSTSFLICHKSCLLFSTLWSFFLSMLATRSIYPFLWFYSFLCSLSVYFVFLLSFWFVFNSFVIRRMTTSSMPTSSDLGANVIPDPIVLSDDETDALDVSRANDLSGNATIVRSVGLGHYCREEVRLSVK